VSVITIFNGGKPLFFDGTGRSVDAANEGAAQAALLHLKEFGPGRQIQGSAGGGTASHRWVLDMSLDCGTNLNSYLS
jgi:hypothetical protein